MLRLRANRRRRALGLFVVGAIVAGACSGTDDEAAPVPETSAPPQSTVPEPVPDDSVQAEIETDRVGLDEALGGTQAVQDFAVIVDMRRYDGDESTSFYDEVLGEAGGSAGAPVDLTGGFTFAAVDGFTASAIDADDDPLPSISIDHGLLVPDPATVEDPVAVTEALAGQLGEGPSATGPFPGLLVEIATADLATARTHVQLGDRSQLDLTFVGSIEPGDDLEVIHLFGQTLPGDPATEEGLTPHELFVQRWREGRIRFLGDGRGVFVHADRTVEAVEGSTMLNRDQKLAVQRARGLEAELADLVFCIGDFCGEKNPGDFAEGGDALYGFGGEIDVGTPDRPRRIALTAERNGFRFFIPTGSGDTFEAPFVDAASVPSFIRSLRAFHACTSAAEDLNEANAFGMVPVLTEFDRFVAGIDPEDPEQRDDEDAPEPEAQPPVGCQPPADELPALPQLPRSPFVDDDDLAAGIWGDIHIATLDGGYYANQAAGEFVLVESPAMQIRTEPFESRDSVSTATAFAADLDGRRVSLHLDGKSWVDGELIEPPRGAGMSVGDGELLEWGDGWVLRWPDGTVVRVDRNAFSLVIVVVVEAMSAPLGGMVGDGDGDPTNDLVTRSGEQLNASADEDFERFYADYVDSWRVTADESLFHYDDGESTETFTIEGFPAEPVTVESLPFDVAEAAETQCRLLGLRDGPPLDACIVDVGATGEIAFAEDAYLAQTVADHAARRAETDEPAAGAGANVLTIGDTTIAFGPNPPIVAPNSAAPSWECQVDDGSLIAVGSFREAAERAYEITIRYFDENTGASGEGLTVRVDRNSQPYAWVNPAEHFADAVESVSLDGSTLTANGMLYVNDPPVVGLGPVNALPEDAELDPFRLVASCDS